MTSTLLEKETIKKQYTYEDYEKLPEGAPYQLVGGELIMTPSLPDFVIEILSPATAYYDLKHKKHVYEKTGVKEYWIVDPMEKSIEVYENTNSGFKLFNQGQQKGSIKSKLLEGFGVEMEKVF